MATPFTEEFIFYEILSKLHVKFLIRLTLVCKHWLSLITKPGSPIHSHLSLSSLCLHQGNSFVVNNSSGYPLNDDDDNNNNNINLDISKLPSDNLVIYGPKDSVYIVGSVNGLVCFFHTSAPHVFSISNPLTKFFKTVDVPTENIIGKSSLFRYDPITNDFKIIVFERCIRLQVEDDKFLLKVHVYSCNSDNWYQARDYAVTDEWFLVCNWNGRPLPYAKFSSNPNVLMVFDVHEEVFKQLPCPNYLIFDDKAHDCLYINWMGSFGLLIKYKRNNDVVYTADETGTAWIKTYIVPNCLKRYRLLVALGNGNLLVQKKGNLFMFEHESNRIKTLNVGARCGRYDVIEYTESLVFIEGMQQQNNKKRKYGL